MNEALNSMMIERDYWKGAFFRLQDKHRALAASKEAQQAEAMREINELAVALRAILDRAIPAAHSTTYVDTRDLDAARAALAKVQS